MSVFFLHRFAVPDLGVSGHDPAILARRLEYLRRHRYRLLSATEVLLLLRERKPLDGRAVFFTVDDGYADFAEVAAPVFAAYDCPVTVFLITDFVGGRLWNWFDKVEWAFRETPRTTVNIEFGGPTASLSWSGAAGRLAASEIVVERLKRVSDAEKEDFIERLQQQLDVAYSGDVPERDRAMTWDDVRACASKGVSFGPHTVRHPVLSRVDDERSKREISMSWNTVKTETSAAVPIFCYPNGTPLDFSRREERFVAAAGMTAALSTVEAPLLSRPSGIDVRDPFAIPRFNYPEKRANFIEIVSGLTTLRPGFKGPPEVA